MTKELEEKNGKLDTQSMLESEFLEQFAKEGGKLPKQAARPSPSQPEVSQSIPSNTNTEVLLVNAYEVRDSLIESFKEVKLGSTLADNITTAINKVGGMITEMGGEAESFDPLANRSGLKAPNSNKYASRVIENTVDAYSLGKIEDARIDDNGALVIAFTGRSDDMSYKAVGTISPKGAWIGNEAIDYVYSPGAGKMAVKIANAEGDWIDQGTDNYEIRWELFEDKALEEPQKNVEKSAGTIEEDKKPLENNLDEDINDDFPIEEK